MFKWNSRRPAPTEHSVDKKALFFGLVSVFLCGLGFSIIAPVVPFLVQPYTDNPAQQAMMVTLLTAVYAVCVFFAAPVLGALSDKFGRRPLLLICLTGSAVGYFVFGIGGALWVLFAGRILEGVTGGSIGTIFAYFADLIPPAQRTRYFGWVSALVGAGTVIGPSLGGLLAKLGYATPMYVGAAVTLLNVGFGLLYMPESLDKRQRLQQITLARLNPFLQLVRLLSMKSLKRLLISAFLLWIPSGSLQAIFSQFTLDTFSWQPTLIGLMFSMMGIQDILAQGLIMPRLLLRYADKRIAMLGMAAELVGYGWIAASALFRYDLFLIVGMFIFGFGDAIYGPSFNGMLSKSVDASEQGRVQGGSQSIQALARMIGPIVGGQIYVALGHATPALMGVLLLVAAMLVLSKRPRVDRQAGA